MTKNFRHAKNEWKKWAHELVIAWQVCLFEPWLYSAIFWRHVLLALFTCVGKGLFFTSGSKDQIWCEHGRVIEILWFGSEKNFEKNQKNFFFWKKNQKNFFRGKKIYSTLIKIHHSACSNTQIESFDIKSQNTATKIVQHQSLKN